MKRLGRVEDIKDWINCRSERALYYTGGDKRWFKDGTEWQRLIGPEDSEDLIFGIAKLKPGDIHLLHHHSDAAELYYILEGKGKFTVDDEVFDGYPGTGVYMSAGAKHKIENDGHQILVFFFSFNRPRYTTVLDEL